MLIKILIPTTLELWNQFERYGWLSNFNKSELKELYGHKG